MLNAHYSLLTTHYSLLTTHYSLLTTHYSLLTTHYSLLTTHYSLFNAHYFPAFHRCLASYGSLARFRDMQRMVSLGDKTLLGTSGDMSDYQHITRLLHQYHVAERCYDDQHVMSPRQWFTALAAVLYRRRSESNPLWTGNVVAGIEPKSGEVFLGCCDLLGTQFEADSIATGFGAHLAQPLLRDAIESAQARGQPLTETEARTVVEKCMCVLYYRDARSVDKIQVAKVTAEGVSISEPYIVETDWSIA
jgi:20S proteasome subunit beta 7